MTYQSWEKLKKLAEEQQTFMLYQAESGSDKNGNDELATKDDHQTCNDNNDVVDVCDRDAEQPSVLGGVETQAEDGLNSNELKNDDIALVDACTLSSKESDMIYSGNQDDDQSGYETDSSGATEGPEEGFDEVDDDVEEVIILFPWIIKKVMIG